MKRIILLLTIITLFLQQACRNRQQTTTQSTDSTASTAVATTPETTADIPITDHLANLGLTPDSDWRGITLGDEFTKVNAVEKGEPFESDSEHIGYTIELKNLETADVLYYQTDKKVSAIDVDLFLNRRPSVTNYQKELEPYFTAHYGTPKPGDGGTVWTGKKGKRVTVKDVSKGKDYGLKIKIAPVGGTTTASTK